MKDLLPQTQSAQELIACAQELSQAVNRLHFGSPVSFIYNPLEYAWQAHHAYLTRFGNGHKRVLFVGMNPGPFGMVQTGIPFGDVQQVREFLGIKACVEKPSVQNPKRPIEGFACTRKEVSGSRLWSLLAQYYGSSEALFADALVLNYCPLAFFEQGRNLPPDKLPASQRTLLYQACDTHLRKVVQILEPEWVIGVGGFAQERAMQALGENALGASAPKIGRVLHPSPASPAANRGWAQAALEQLKQAGVWA